MKRQLTLIAAVLLFALSAFAQTNPGQITAAGAGCAANNCVAITLPSQAASAALILSGTFSATVQFEVSVDGTNFVAANAAPQPSGALVASATAPGTWSIPVPGMTVVRARCSAYTSGTATAYLQFSSAPYVNPAGALPTGSNVIGGVTGSGNFNIAGTTTTNTAAPLGLGVLPVQFNTALPTLTSGNSAYAQSDSSGRVLIGSIAGALPTGANSLGTVGITNTAGSTDPCQNPSVLKSSAKIQVTTTTAAALVPLSSTKIIYVCGWEATIQGSATTVGTVQLEYGTQTTNPCDTGTVTLTGVLAGNITASVPTLVGRSGPGTIYSTTASQQLCAVSTGTTISVQGDLTYVQQ